MKKMIDELWDGEISPQDTLISDNQEYRELQHRQSQNKAELLEVLSNEQKELLEKFCATEIELNGISEREAFTADSKSPCGWRQKRSAQLTTSKRMTAEIPLRSAVFFSKLNARYRLKNGKIYVIIKYRQIGVYGGC